jgi:hypothetical protein
MGKDRTVTARHCEICHAVADAEVDKQMKTVSVFLCIFAVFWSFHSALILRSRRYVSEFHA